MKRILLLALLLPGLCLADTVGTVSGTSVVMVPASSSAQVMQCAPAFKNMCWPDNPPSMGPSVALGSLPAAGSVWAQIGSGVPSWQPVSAITMPSVTPVTPVPPSITNGQAVLNWTTPTLDTNGAPLATTPGDAITGYNIYQGTSVSSLAKVAAVAAGVTTYTFNGLSPGQYVFDVTAVNSFGESAQSPSQSATIQQTGSAPGAPPTLTVTVTVSVP